MNWEVSHISANLWVSEPYIICICTPKKNPRKEYFSLCVHAELRITELSSLHWERSVEASAAELSCLKTLKPLLLKQWSPKEHREPLWCTLEAAWCFQFNMCCSGGILVLSLVAQKAEPLLLQTFPRGGSRRCQWRWARGWAALGMVRGREGMDGWAVEWDLQLQWLYALPGSTCTWGTSAKFTAAVQRSWAAQAGSVGESVNGGVLWSS